MTVRNLSRGLIIAGAAGIGMSILVLLLSGGKTTIRPLVILAAEVSLLLVLPGIGLRRAAIDEVQPGKRIRALVNQILDLPTFPWVFIGFLFVYLLLFIAPMFLNPNLRMQYFTGYIPNLEPIGNDLRVKMDLLRGLIVEAQSPYTIGFYPPLTYVLFAPLLLIRDQATLYRLFSLFTFLNYGLLTLLLPLKIVDRKHFPLVLLLFVTGLFSYGFQFELERGQYNVFTFLLCLSAIYIFHYQHKYRLLAYVLFSLSVQLKLYPAIFIVMFVDDWREWKTVLLRFVGIGLFNLALFFIMGYQTFLGFFGSVTRQIVNPSWIGPWNHSISSFISVAKREGFGLVEMDTLRVFRHNAERVEMVLILVFLLLFVFALVIFHFRKEAGLDPYLLLACTIGALILPISYDYTLSVLTVPILLLFCGIPEMNRPWRKLTSILLILGISAAYFAMLIPYGYRPRFLDNVFPLLFLILILTSFSNLLRFRNGKAQTESSSSELATGSFHTG